MLPKQRYYCFLRYVYLQNPDYNLNTLISNLNAWKVLLQNVSFFSNSVLQGESVQNSTYNISPKASDTEIPKKPLTSDVYAKIVKVLISLCLKLQCSS